jgi:hypothetical protein
MLLYIIVQVTEIDSANSKMTINKSGSSQILAPNSNMAPVNNTDNDYPNHHRNLMPKFSKKFLDWPLLFERASKNWWHPQFDSSILEQQYWKSLLPRTTKRFQFGLIYLLLLASVICLYFGILSTPNWEAFLILAIVLFVAVASTLLVTIGKILKTFLHL